MRPGKEPPARALLASCGADGSRAFFTDDQKLTTKTSAGGSDLYEFNSETGERDLTVALEGKKRRC